MNESTYPTKPPYKINAIISQQHMSFGLDCTSFAMSNVVKKNVLLIGGGSVGTIAALNLEAGGLANVTLVLRSNYNVVNDKGFDIESCDHGAIKGWKPSIGMLCY